MRGIALLTLVVLAGPAAAEVVDLTPAGFLVKHELLVRGQPETLFRLLGEVGKWWNPAHTYSGDAANLSIDMRPGGCFCEKFPGGGGVQHMSVLYVAPGKALRLGGGLGPLQGAGLAGSMTFELAAQGEMTRLRFIYSVGGYMQGSFEKLAPMVNAMTGEQVGRFKAYAETGRAESAK